jgi:hypothetical protein
MNCRRLLVPKATAVALAIGAMAPAVAEEKAQAADSNGAEVWPAAGGLRTVPDPLRPWADWAMYGHEAERCPFLNGDTGVRNCVWPSSLELTLDDRGGKFSQHFRVEAEGFAVLPGSDKRWPQEVRVDGKPAALIVDQGSPAVLLAPGDHQATGLFVWDSLPESLPVPRSTGLLSITLRGTKVAFPQREEDGRIWLQRRSEANEERALDVAVYRRVDDNVPLMLTTRMDLRVAGKAREEVLGKPLPKDFVPMALTGSLPARLDVDGNLRVQLRPGKFSIELTARHEGPATSLTPGNASGLWPADELWVFDAHPGLRQVVVEGVAAVDPQQTTLPPDWKRLPAYRIKRGETMKLTERQRGDADPAPDRLTLERTVWLDFDGKGYSVLDEMSGTLSRSWRLSVSPPTDLGRVSVGGQDVLITRAEPNGPAGVEVRQGNLQLTAESRVEGTGTVIPSTSWAHPFQQVSASLNLPPGWRLLAASGADDVPGSWVRRWTLLDLFLLLITALAVARVHGRIAAAVAFATLLLTIPEGDAPKWSWLPVLAFAALAQVLPQGRVRGLTRLCRVVALAALAVIGLMFAVEHIRLGMYPSLAGGTIEGDRWAGKADLLKEAESEMAESGGSSSGFMALSRNAKAQVSQQKMGWSGQLYNYENQNQAAVQTGRGLPRWRWETQALRWSGPVDPGQQVQLVLLPPQANRALAFIRVILIGLLFSVLLGTPGDVWPGALRRTFAAWLRRNEKPAPGPDPLSKRWRTAQPDGAHVSAGKVPLAALLAVVALAFPIAARGQTPIPDEETLARLRDRMLHPPSCFPNCASLSRLMVEVSSTRMSGRMEASAAAATAVPLPGGLSAWTPNRVLVDQKPAALLRDEQGVLWMEVPPGTHDVLFDGPLPSQERVVLALPLRPARVEVKAEGWSVDGVHEDGLPDDSLQFTRVARRPEEPAEAAQAQTLPPFMQVERTLLLGLNWEMDSRVARLTPSGAATLVEVPLLPGESVTTAEVRVVNGKALVNLAAQASEVRWHSVLARQNSIHLKAAGGLPFVETWRLVVSPDWHATWSGIPPIHLDATAERVPEWRPWPGESVQIDVRVPEAVPGQTLTIERSDLTIRPGLRSSDATLDLDLRSSRGGEHLVILPTGAELERVSINGTVLPLRLEGRKLALPLSPGTQKIQIGFRDSAGIATHFDAPTVDVGAASVNASVNIDMPAQRWILFAGGAPVGPAVLFWSLLVALFLAAIGLGQLRLTPLRVWDWALLAIGLTQIPILAAAVPVAWLLLLGWRRGDTGTGRFVFNSRQILLALMTAVALAILFFAIREGLLGIPDMQVAGNGSSERQLRWFQDRSGAVLPVPWVISVPLLVYRGVMLAWALWLAAALVRWLRWGWTCFAAGGTWKRPPRVAAPTPATPSAGP